MQAGAGESLGREQEPRAKSYAATTTGLKDGGEKSSWSREGDRLIAQAALTGSGTFWAEQGEKGWRWVQRGKQKESDTYTKCAIAQLS